MNFKPAQGLEGGGVMTQLPDKRYFRPDEVAAELMVSRRTVYTWIKHGYLTAMHTRSGIIRIDRSQLDYFLSQYMDGKYDPSLKTS